MQLTKAPIINGGSGANHWQPELRGIRVSARTVLTTISFVAAVSGDDNERIISRYLDATRPDHIRFVFDFNAATGAYAEPRFWITETVAPDSVKKFTIQEAIAAILGAREDWPRGEIERAWQISSNVISDLINSGHLKSPAQTGRLQRADLEKFLLSRWSGNRE